ncbi:MAG: hypothetical protein ABIQ93_06255 [Saprospiraceae bacterium]
MEYKDFEMVLSRGRLRRYLVACFYNRHRALNLYRANIRLSGKFLQVVCIVEIALRNAIDRHYLDRYKNDWVISQTNHGGYLARPECENSRLNAQKAINKQGEHYSHDRTIAELNFGFWRYAFGPKEFAAAGSTLLEIFLNRPPGINQKEVFDRLGEINNIRNRIAHHDPICFKGAFKSTRKVEDAYYYAIEFIDWLGLNKTIVLQDIDFVIEEVKHIANI